MLDAGSLTKLLPIPPKCSQYQTLKLKIRSREPAFTTRFFSAAAKPPPKKELKHAVQSGLKVFAPFQTSDKKQKPDKKLPSSIFHLPSFSYF